jgi:hypothetical protein
MVRLGNSNSSKVPEEKGEALFGEVPGVCFLLFFGHLFFCFDAKPQRARAAQRLVTRTMRIIKHLCNPASEDHGVPFACGCRSKVTREEAEDLVARGLARWKLQRKVKTAKPGDFEIVELSNAIVLTRWPWRWRVVNSCGGPGMQLVRRV